MVEEIFDIINSYNTFRGAVMKYKLIADASCDLPKELAEKYDITLVPIEVRFGEEIYPQGLSNEEFYKKIYETGMIPKTSMPNQFLFEEIMTPYVNKPDTHVIVLTISSEMTATIHQVEGAVQALKMQNVTYRQSTVTTWAQGAILIELAKFIEKDDDLEHVIKKLDELISKVRLVAVINDLKYLKASGRLSAASAVMGSMLNVKPIISGHSDCPEMIDKLLQKYASMLDISPEGQVICDIGCVVGSHVGPKCYGIVYFV